MRHKRIALFALSAALLLSACNTDKSAVTSSVMEEVAATITAKKVTAAA